MEKLQNSIGIRFNNIRLLETAITHTSFANENNVESNEKLEFLGDSILEFVTSNFLFEKYRKLSEGEMTKVRASVVCEESLYNVAVKHNFSDFLRIGRSELAQNGNKRPAVLADSVEAVIAAIYLDSGIEKAEKFIITNLEEPIKIASQNVGQRDYKTVLQEKLQVNGDIDIRYNTINEEGPDHDKTFTVELIVNGKTVSTGVGQNKKSAEMDAAKKALKIK